MQIFLRSTIVKRQKIKFSDTWPIYPGSETIPIGWRGWPKNKKFALVLTHDVEHQRGYERVKELMQLEIDLGFVSSFNFVPERDYKVEKELLEHIKGNGFEYGIHGLNHDGKLFKGRQIFNERAIKINNYIKDWGVVGFRAPAMHHNLDWIGGLNIKYDLSTFDTDPFEPQPEGGKTIFPYWVKSKNGNDGYVELPYTLVQDFTLFILMKEQTPRIWINKLNWIAEKGGLALLNVHPDYTNLSNENKLEEFPVNHYLDFLKYIKENYSDQYWNDLPHNVASYSREHLSKLEKS